MERISCLITKNEETALNRKLAVWIREPNNVTRGQYLLRLNTNGTNKTSITSPPIRGESIVVSNSPPPLSPRRTFLVLGVTRLRNAGTAGESVVRVTTNRPPPRRRRRTHQGERAASLRSGAKRSGVTSGRRASWGKKIARKFVELLAPTTTRPLPPTKIRPKSSCV